MQQQVVCGLHGCTTAEMLTGATDAVRMTSVGMNKRTRAIQAGLVLRPESGSLSGCFDFPSNAVWAETPRKQPVREQFNQKMDRRRNEAALSVVLTEACCTGRRGPSKKSRST